MISDSPHVDSCRLPVIVSATPATLTSSRRLQISHSPHRNPHMPHHALVWPAWADEGLLPGCCGAVSASPRFRSVSAAPSERIAFRLAGMCARAWTSASANHSWRDARTRVGRATAPPSAGSLRNATCTSCAVQAGRVWPTAAASGAIGAPLGPVSRSGNHIVVKPSAPCSLAPPCSTGGQDTRQAGLCGAAVPGREAREWAR